MLDLLYHELLAVERYAAGSLRRHPSAKAFAYPREMVDRVSRAAGYAAKHLSPHVQPEKPVPPKTQTYSSDQIIQALLAEKSDLQKQVADLQTRIGEQYDATVQQAIADPDVAAMLARLFPTTPESPAVTISTTDAYVVPLASGPASLAFPVTLSAVSASAVSVAYKTADGTAMAGTDYSGDEGTLVIKAGDTTATIPVTVAAMPAPPATAKTLTLTLSDPTGATLGTATATGSIGPVTAAA